MTGWSQLGRRLSLTALLLTAAACADGTDQPTADQAIREVDESVATTAEVTVATADVTVATADVETVAPGSVDPVALPVREGAREETTHAVPHVQLDAEPVPEVDAELRRRAFSLPGIENRESLVSLPGAQSFWLADDVELVRPEALLGGREFAHIHPNGSLHVSLPVDRAFEVAETKWGEYHPWVGREDFWDGLVMVYTPETVDELEITMQLIVEAYNFVTDSDLDPADFP